MSMSGAFDRIVRIEGARNFRDAGGYLNAAGQQVRRGVLYRAGHPGHIPQAAEAAFKELNLKAVYDFRSNSERASQPWPIRFTLGLDYRSRDHEHTGGDIVALLKNAFATTEDARQAMRATYRQLPYEQVDSLKAFFRLIANGAIPLLFHCSAGKDRTGVAAALLLSVLDVPRETIIEDFILTEHLNDPSQMLFKIDPNGPQAFLADVSPDIWRIVMSSPRAYLEEMFAELERRHGSVHSYFSEFLGFNEEDLECIRENLLEPAAVTS